MSFEERVSQLENQMQKDLAHERKKSAKVELRNAEYENKIYEQEKNLNKMEKKLDQTGTIEKQL